MPSPNPTDQQIDKVREVIGELSFGYTSELVAKLNNGQWARALELCAAWAEYPAGDTIALEGGRDAVLYSSELSRGDIRSRMRLMLGLPELRNSSITGSASSMAIPNTQVW